MSDEPIKTIEQAKAFFVEMNGVKYYMWREGRFYDEYKQLSISDQTEMEWREELLEAHINKIKKIEDVTEISNIHSRMYDLFEDLKTERVLMKILEITQLIREKVPMNQRAIVAETINGRTARSTRRGLIYKAYDMKNIPAAKAFVELSLHFSTYDGQDNFGLERSRKAMELCNDIKMELGL